MCKPLAEAVLRVAKKYEIPANRRSVIKRFEEQFPTKLEDFRSRQPSQRTALNILDLNIFTLIHTIREHDLPHLLPSAYHHASQLSYSQLVAALTQDRWTMSDMVPCLQMRQHLLILHGQLLEWFSLQSGGGIPFRDCEDYSSCSITELRNEIRISFGKTGHSINWSHDWLKNAALKYDWCKVCRSKLQERYDRQLQSAWDKLNTVEV
ncbi:hypothetical protein K474DRAFT_892379 [Panus rudis PR-1116 ss-1]|nr:hypothetical protein K474DRAFT_892379 [Panus rudis PR-1116 ss-1]